MNRMKLLMTSALQALSSRRAMLASLVVAAAVMTAGGTLVVARTATDQLADATFSRLSGGADGQQVLDHIADKVVERLAGEGGLLDETQHELVSELVGLAGRKLDGVDSDRLLDGVRGDVVKAGLGKLESIDSNAIVGQVTAALVAQANAEIQKLDLDALAKSALSEVVNNLDLERLVNEWLKTIDVEGIASKAVAEQLGGSGGGSNLLRLFLR